MNIDFISIAIIGEIETVTSQSLPLYSIDYKANV